MIRVAVVAPPFEEGGVADEVRLVMGHRMTSLACAASIEVGIDRLVVERLGGRGSKAGPEHPRKDEKGPVALEEGRRGLSTSGLSGQGNPSC